MFACGTAAVITPIGTVRCVDGDFTVGDGGTGPVTTSLRQSLVDIQRGRAEDRHGWVHKRPLTTLRLAPTTPHFRRRS